MERLGKALGRLLFPGLGVVLVCVPVAAALVSMLSLETAMLTQFDNGENPAAFRRVMTGATGGCVCLGVLAMAVYMIATATGQLRRMEYQKGGTTNGEHSGAGG